MALNPATNNSLNPDYRFYWIYPTSFKKGNCKVFDYGYGKEMAIATFQILYPDYQIKGIEEFKKVGKYLHLK